MKRAHPGRMVGVFSVIEVGIVFGDHEGSFPDGLK